METVYAYRDDGCIAPWSRWKPHAVLCTESADHRERPGIGHVVKLAQGSDGAAALISEVICTRLIAAGGLNVLDGRFVMAGPAFATANQIEEGRYYGTVRRFDVVDGPPEKLDVLADPREIVDLWAFDSWLATIDRNTYGNILLERADAEHFRVIAADQSDCFGGAGALASGRWQAALAKNSPAESVAFLQQAIFQCGRLLALTAAIERVEQAAQQLDQAFDLVPQEWWKRAGIPRPHEIRDALAARARRLRDILRVGQWEELDDDDFRGAYLL